MRDDLTITEIKTFPTTRNNLYVEYLYVRFSKIKKQANIESYDQRIQWIANICFVRHFFASMGLLLETQLKSWWNDGRVALCIYAVYKMMKSFAIAIVVYKCVW